MQMTGTNRLRRIAGRFVGAAAALALAGGLSIGAATTAEAATVWDRVASCESGGNWKINTHNGYYGGLQFSSSTWRGYGGRSYASQANGATKGEQIRVAQRVLKAQGPGAWPVCSRHAGLSRSNGAAVSTSTTVTKKATTTKKASSSAHKTVSVRSGDTLSKIAARYHVSGGWKGLWKLNTSTVSNPNRINIGQKLRIS